MKRRIRKDRLAILTIGTVTFMALAIWGVVILVKGIHPGSSNEKKHSQQITSQHNKETKQDKITITATGDILLEEPILNWFDNGSWKDYMTALQPIFQQDDLTISNLEVPIGGEELGITGIDYSFNAPAITAKNIKEQGIDYVTTSNNHAMDRGEQGIVNTLKNLDEQGIGHTGSFASQEEMDTPAIIDVKGIKIGIVTCTYNTNQPLENPWDTLVFGSADSEQTEQFIQQAAAMKEKADVVIAAVHWGTEFTYDLNYDQINISQRLADVGVDVIIGNHPHTLQPAKWLTGVNGNQTLCFYSLGNLVSSAYMVDRADETFQNMYEVGALAQFNIVKDGNTYRIKNPVIIPYVNQFSDEYQNFKLIPFSEYTEDLASQHDQHRFSDLFTKQWLQDQIQSVFDGSGIPVKGLDESESGQ